MPAPTISDVTTYLGSDVEFSAPEIANAYAAERAAQKHACLVPLDTDEWPADLSEALKRRVLRNLNMKALPLGVQSEFSEAAVATIRIGSDPEVRRLEGPYRRRTVG